MKIDKLKNKIFTIQSESEFNNIALDIFKYQYDNVKIYKTYCDELGFKREEIKQIEHIPFLPISFFRTHQVISKNHKEETIFYSSGTTSSESSKHYVADLNLYNQSILKGFEYFYGNPKSYTILALLPSYLEREGASLVYMTELLMKHSQLRKEQFYIHNFKELHQQLIRLIENNKNIILIGVSFALLDFIEQYHIPAYNNLIIMETGGMKGKRKEITREELHLQLCKGFNVANIHSEYGMTELLSQSYSKGKGLYETVPWKKILLRDPNDPLSPTNYQTGGINIIDLANIDSCSFIATQDLGKIYPNGKFEILGRIDYAQIRGCNLMYT